MLQFSQDEITRLRMKAQADTSFVYTLMRDVEPMKQHLLIPKTGIATWEGFYACPKDSVRLTFRLDQPHRHLCPVCQREWEGEIYDGAWWRIVNRIASESCYKAALVYLLTGDRAYFSHAKAVLMEYALYYPEYEIHGGIPYNNPGKANAQTLCDAVWIRGLIQGYDIIQDTLEEEERQFITANLFEIAGDFFKRYRSNQIHNHECIADATAAMLGFLLDREDLIAFGVYEQYGLRYQLEHGVLADGFWFEGTTSYHFYAMEQFTAYELFARNTPHSFLNDTRFLEILRFPVHILMPGGKVPLLNDIGGVQNLFHGKESIYELAQAVHPCEEFRFILSRCYDGRERNNIFSFMYGCDDLKRLNQWLQTPYHNKEGSGLTTMYGPEGRFLLVKHAPYGGEHDHYDRLGILFAALGKDVLPDMGTCPYGAPLHYAYYKNTGTHNTVCLNGKNQPPANCRVHAYELKKDHTFLDVSVTWDNNYKPLDSFTIVQWDAKAYEGASIRRRIHWYGDFFVDIVEVSSFIETDIDCILHVRGQRLRPQGDAFVHSPWGKEPPYCYLTDVQKTTSRVQRWDCGDGIRFDLRLLAPDKDIGLYAMQGFDNPSDTMLSYLIQRVHATKAIFIQVCEAYGDKGPAICDAHYDSSLHMVVVQRSDGQMVRMMVLSGEEEVSGNR